MLVDPYGNVKCARLKALLLPTPRVDKRKRRALAQDQSCCQQACSSQSINHAPTQIGTGLIVFPFFPDWIHSKRVFDWLSRTFFQSAKPMARIAPPLDNESTQLNHYCLGSKLHGATRRRSSARTKRASSVAGRTLQRRHVSCGARKGRPICATALLHYTCSSSASPGRPAGATTSRHQTH